ncbi:NADH:ubiquinone oxidoreductase subunit 5 (subunit L)/multisubunit Na+/H+ antiporter MnhA subunit [Pseudonocardia hierapolitana]|uniref:NADH:ubiquinone oxidoreductase subunit 5 (Subunit L)/multisubunit Na+/H+ antiporter MnhA subunit n=1 Tax=Pseudonocardia hierapolitana TaxID=1128676 RepID=A0A561SWM2_9PSEU|nr:proton-conducting transporter membrane subunit [Pseudonocardia hierapolitana]TWF79253.1 NADH:ubiquinone oxidoreductase subunit 5 (subunit L)/multisubunit Na+/H+ antiporter MnhA subunit [Pseudonocardia hierapolitana]
MLWWLVAVPLLAGAGLALAGRRADRAAPAAGVLVAVAVLALAITAALTRPAVDAPLVAGVRAGLAVDGLSALMVVTVAGATLAVLAHAAGEAELRTARFVGCMLLFAGAMLVTVTATTLAALLMAWEVMGAMSWALIAHRWREPESVRAAHTAFLTTRLADAGLYVAAGAALAGGVGSLALAELPVAREPWLHVVAAGLVVAALGKSAQLPFSFWLSQAMRGPSPVSALLHSATMVAAGAYLLLRLAPLLETAGWAAPLVAWVGAATALLMGLVAVAQSDLKQLLAASTCAQIGFMVLAAGVGGVAGGALQLVAHAATKSLLFLGAGAWLVLLGTKQLGELRGAARRYPLVGVTFTVGAASLAGLPPLSLWVTKDLVLAAALDRSTALYVVGLVAALVSAIYSAKAVWWVWQPPPSDERRVRRIGTDERAVRRNGVLPLGVLALLAALLGIPLLTLASAPWELVLSGALAVVAVAVTWRVAGRIGAPPVLASWLGIERLSHAVVVRPVLGLARLLARFDDGLDSSVTAVARGTVAVAQALDRRGEGAVDGAVRGIADGARALGRLARRPQTGQVHQYYAQAAAALAVLALVVIVMG